MFHDVIIVFITAVFIDTLTNNYHFLNLSLTYRLLVFSIAFLLLLNTAHLKIGCLFSSFTMKLQTSNGMHQIVPTRTSIGCGLQNVHWDQPGPIFIIGLKLYLTELF